MDKKIIFIEFNIPFLKKEYNDSYVKEISNIFEIEMWNANALTNQDYDLSLFPPEISNVIKIKNLKDFKKRISNYNTKNLIIITQNLPNDSRILNFLTKKRIKIGQIMNNPFVMTYLEYSYKLHSTNLIDKMKGFLAINMLTRKLYLSFTYQKKNYDFVFATNNLFFTGAKHYPQLHHIKYDEYLNLKNQKPIIRSKKYCVFIDTNLPNLQDIILNNEKSVNSEKYYQLLDKFFKIVEEKYNVEVIIALHPKTLNPELFGKRKTFMYETGNLIYNSEFVLTHDSTSNITAILCEKPILFLYYDEMFKCGAQKISIRTVEFSRLLNSSLINLEKIKNIKLKVDKDRYKWFTNNLILSKKNKKYSNEELIVNYLKKL